MRYSHKEVRGLIEGYAELREKKNTWGHGLTILCRLVDIEDAIGLLPPKEYQAILLHGLLRSTVRDAEQALGVSRSTLHDRYESGVSLIVTHLNEGVM